MAKTNTYCANGHSVPAGERVCPVCGAPAVSKGAARRNAAIAGVVALGLLAGGGFGIHHLVTRNRAPEQQQVVVEQQVEPPAAPAAPPAAEPAEPAQAAEPAQPAAPNAQLSGANFVRDETGLLSAHGPDLTAALDRVAADTPYRLFVVFVNSFGGTDGVRYAQQVSQQAGLGTNDIVLAVATDDQEYGFSYDNNIALTGTQLDTIQEATESTLGQALRGQVDWTAAPIAAANALIAVAH